MVGLAKLSFCRLCGQKRTNADSIVIPSNQRGSAFRTTEQQIPRCARDDYVDANTAADHGGMWTDCFFGESSKRFGPSYASTGPTYDAMRSSPPYIGASLENRTDQPRSPAPGNGTSTSRSEQLNTLTSMSPS